MGSAASGNNAAGTGGGGDGGVPKNRRTRTQSLARAPQLFVSVPPQCDYANSTPSRDDFSNVKSGLNLNCQHVSKWER
jgi:hypothetical protein